MNDVKEGADHNLAKRQKTAATLDVNDDDDSTAQSFAYAAEVIKAGKGNIRDFSISRTTFYTQLKDCESEFATKIMQTFLNDTKVKYIIIHWDGKKVNS